MKKNKIIAASTVGAFAVLGMGAFAFFSDQSEEDLTGTVGTVDLEGTLGLDLSNKENINPGDEETPYDPEEPGNTTPHELSFAVTNTGTKSVRTRNIIDITVTSRDGETNLDPTKFYLYEKDEEEPWANTELSELEDLAVTKFTYVNDAGETVLRYIIEGASLNGAEGKLEDSDITASDVDRDSVVVDEDVRTATYDYYLGLDKTTLDEYQGASVKIDLTVQAMQYRNTTGEDVDGNWTDVLKDTIIAGGQSSGE